MPAPKTVNQPFWSVRRLLLGYELTPKHLAQACRMSEQTAARRLANPGDLTLNELRRVCRNAGIPADEIREAIKFG